MSPTEVAIAGSAIACLATLCVGIARILKARNK